eukprot:TRINITY_DN4833_c0_g1_i2.p1 TRINITY_DN4833_c0_g1~~TRINITY_DN4833_c0_g1_i2.p1  ORF type:complete len:216 (+),score=54.94 TRINITY_DN4833_c0_g1_i2:80-649(+)
MMASKATASVALRLRLAVLRGASSAARASGVRAVASAGARGNLRRPSAALLLREGVARPLAAASVRCFSAAGSWKLNTPELGGESIKEGTIMEWKKKVGDSVKKGEIIVVIETDKVTVDVPADQDGHLSQILLEADATCEVGQPLCVLAPGAGSGGASAAPAAAAAAPAPASPPAALRLMLNVWPGLHL